MTDKSGKITLTLKGKSLAYTTEIEPELAARVMSMCLSGANQPVTKVITDQVPVLPDALNIGARISPAEFLNQYGPKRNPDKILALAVYLEHHDDKKKFNPGEINRLFRDAGEVIPANFTRDFKWAISSGWIARDTTEKNSYYVTTSGRKVLEQGFPTELVKKSKNKAAGRRKSSKATKK